MKPEKSSNALAETMGNFDSRQIPYSNLTDMMHRHMPYVGYSLTKVHVAGAFWTFVGIWTAMGLIGADFVTNILAIVYPAWMSYKCEKNGSSPTQWLAYWIIYSLFFVVECSQGVTARIPCYFAIKLTIMLWCMYPGAGNGSTVIYTVALKPGLQMLDHFMQQEGGDKKNKHSPPHDHQGKGSPPSGKEPALKKSSSRDSLKNGKHK